MYSEPAGAGGCRPHGHIRSQPDRGDNGADRRGRSDEHGKGCGEVVVHVLDGRSHRGDRQNHHVDCSRGVPNRLVGNDLLPTNPVGNADDFRTDTVGVQHPAEMGRCLGEVADTLSDGAFLRGDALLRGLLRAAAL